MRIRGGRRGIALVTTILLLPILVVLGFCLTVMGVHNLSLSQANEHSKRAEYIAEAGAAEGVEQLKTNTAYAGTFVHTMVSLPDTATVNVINNYGGSSSQTAPNGAPVPVGFAYVYSKCTTDNRVTRSTGVLVHITQPNPFRYSEFGDSNVKLGGGAKTDSWDSSLGTYASTKQNTGGNIGTNGVSSGAVDLVGAPTFVYGDISVGVGGNPAFSISTSGSLGGLSNSTLTSTFPMSPVTIPSNLMSTFLGTPSGGTLTPGYYGDVRVSAHGTLQLQAGTYVFDSITLVGNSNLVAPSSGQALVYITGKNGSTLDLTGGAVVNSNGMPKNLMFEVAGTSQVKVAGGSSAAFVVYAPEASIKVTGGADIWGSLIAKSIDNQGGTFVHYDKNLGAIPGSPPSVSSWQRF